MINNTILLIEDDELDVISVQRSLAKLDFDVQLLLAYNGVEAIRLLQERLDQDLAFPEVIILDLNMPKMNGMEFLHQASLLGWLSASKVFVMTTSSDISDRNSVEQYDIAGYLIKPLNFNNNNKRQESMQGFFDFHLRNIFIGNES